MNEVGSEGKAKSAAPNGQYTSRGTDTYAAADPGFSHHTSQVLEAGAIWRYYDVGNVWNDPRVSESSD